MQILQRWGLLMRSGDGDRLETTIQIELPIGPISTLMTQASDTPATRRARAHDIDHDPTGQFAGQGAQLLVGGTAERRKQRERSIGILTHEVVEGRLVELTHLGRHLVESGLAAQTVP